MNGRGHFRRLIKSHEAVARSDWMPRWYRLFVLVFSSHPQLSVIVPVFFFHDFWAAYRRKTISVDRDRCVEPFFDAPNVFFCYTAAHLILI